MSRYYSIDDANALLPEVSTVVERLRRQRDELVDLRDAHRDLEGDDAELRRVTLRMRGIVDQMAADVAWLDERSIVLRDIATGLLDFPALASGREVWLCWRTGEAGVGFWHDLDEGFAGRQPLAELPDPAARA